jgi:hypothetical protein
LGRYVLAAAAVYFIAGLYEVPEAFIVPNYVLLFSVYIGLLILMREITREDLNILSRLYRRSEITDV